MISIKNVYRLGVKELWSLLRDPMMLVLIVYAFTVAIYAAATSAPETLHNVPIAIVDLDDSILSKRITSAFLKPYFLPAKIVSTKDMDLGMDQGDFTFTLNIPPNFAKDLLAQREPEVQLNIDTTRMSQAFVGNGAIAQIVLDEVNEYLLGYKLKQKLPISVEERIRFNPTLNKSWLTAIVELINIITMLSMILTGAALIREREHGTLEHLLVMPIAPVEIMLAKVWSMALVVLIATAFSLRFVVQDWLKVGVVGSEWLFLAITFLHLFSTTSMGIFMATIAKSMPQFGLLIILVIMPLEILSGGLTPRESMPKFIQDIMLLAPTTHFTTAGEAILFRGAGIGVVWPQIAAITVIGAMFFIIAMLRFRKTLVSLN